MSFTDKAKNKAQEMTGMAKERIGDATDNERLRAEGASEQSTARAKQAGENVKQAGRDVKDAFEK
ncbi:CsbD family protein [Micromonospora sp. WMMD1128]|uniref:CsbD family protein n=1 Tax=unclassified Micromonospora TaxID=2617518 RepID=UPI00248B4AEE|nr:MULTISPECIES: CsbD family protein [unclassified Micromonospora]WBB76563.1 CsbD family protein [Micromonospora sp. WMMD1128]WFE35653.1 CsbD family protein [Micromonospora sp. WMMD975]